MDGINAILLLVLLIGHTALWITFVNRTHGMAIGKGPLRQLRHLHDAMVFIGPILILWGAGWHGPQLLRGGSWKDVGLFWGTIFTLCAIGVVWLLWLALRSLLQRVPAALRNQQRRVIDVARELGHKPVAAGPYSVLARVPLNEQFQIEVNEKVFLAPGLPAAWDGLSILHISDWHFQGTVTKDFFVRAASLAAELPVDLVCFTGDLVDNMQLLDWIPETLGQLEGSLGKCFILGNHDWDQEEQAIRRAVTDIGWRDVRDEPLRLERNGSVIEIAGDETPWMGSHPSFSPTADYRILMSHTPDNIGWARRHGVELMLSGHNHGGQIRLPVIGPVYSPSLYGCKYASGIFWESPTLMHVSRGLAGEHPLRWRCLPEITRVVLRCPERESEIVLHRSADSPSQEAARARRHSVVS